MWTETPLNKSFQIKALLLQQMPVPSLPKVHGSGHCLQSGNFQWEEEDSHGEMSQCGMPVENQQEKDS